jgi:hypothetical protein
MMELPFELVPFPDPELPDIRITGTIFRENHIFTIQYSLSGKIDDILLPVLNPNPCRKQELWLGTCFEFFLARPDQPQYWEFNFSPSGDWNVFHMDAYRRIGFHEEDLIQNPCLDIGSEVDCFELEAAMDLSPILAPETLIQAGVTAVVQSRPGPNETYWALIHPRPQADFHLRESFILTL